jgi:hypothetical protein
LTKRPIQSQSNPFWCTAERRKTSKAQLDNPARTKQYPEPPTRISDSILRLWSLAGSVAAGPSIARRRPSKTQIVVVKRWPAQPAVPYPNRRNEGTAAEHTIKTTAAKATNVGTKSSAVKSEGSRARHPSTRQAASLSSTSASAASESRGVGRYRSETENATEREDRGDLVQHTTLPALTAEASTKWCRPYILKRSGAIKLPGRVLV